jgi:hypothetical protein
MKSITLSLKKKLLSNTGFFEGNNGYSNVTGNADGQGMSFGIIQYNLGQETLQPLLKEFIASHNTDFTSIFGATKAKSVKDMLKISTSKQVAWGDSISTPKGALVSDWQACFEALGKNSYCISLQISHAEDYFNHALNYASDFGITTTQGLAYLFDQSVHEWSFSVSKSDMLSSIAGYKLAKGSAWAGDPDILTAIHTYVISADGQERREAIRYGVGIVHGKNYNISNFGLSYYDNF